MSIIKIQAELQAPKGNFNSFGKYKYRSCEDILTALKPLLEKYNSYINISDEVCLIGDRYYIKAIATLTDETGNKHQATAFAREPESKKGMDESQITGTASSYARKYALNGLLAIDDTKDADTMDNRPEPKIDETKVTVLKEALEKGKVQESGILKYYKVAKLEEMTVSQFMEAMAHLEKKGGK